MEDISDADCMHVKRDCEDFKTYWLMFWKTLSKIRIFNCIYMLLMAEKGNRGGRYHAFHQYAKSSNKYMKDYTDKDTDKE